ncbi:hypothetical protein QVZ41_13645 [Wenyingzhuangia sp. chi5]|uniref:Uncharacterized protein n=1 Tax=Wenyingzhuangia gilva TaxID=3057677 RepID=A0ABT8VV96_9FLAO|nr:hypothetical protein [Wenyingzhuangia sp. chi5]MDO3695889.1 hypothetical protein [Wenyingzhuangia sp. chi5]
MEKKDAYNIVAVADAVKLFGKKFGWQMCWVVLRKLSKFLSKPGGLELDSIKRWMKESNEICNLFYLNNIFLFKGLKQVVCNVT